MARKKLITLAKELDFKTETDYFEYCIESHVNGNFTQCKKLFADMMKPDQKRFLAYVKDYNNEIFSFYLNLM